MKKSLIAAAVAGSFALPNAASAIEVVGDKLEIYGKLHISSDFVDSDSDIDDSELVFSSNSSRLGFKGKWPLNDAYTMLYQIEQEISLDEDAGETFATRNTFVGLSGGFGDILFGRMDTPFKDLGKEFTVFGDTIADRRAILGSGSGESNRTNERSENGLMWRYATDITEFRAMYSPDAGDTSEINDYAREEDNAMYSLSALLELDALAFGAAYENWDNMEGAVGEGEIKGYRLGASYDFGLFKVGGIYEDLDAEDIPALSRAAYGANVAFDLSDATSIKAQWLHAEESEADVDDAADMFSIGAESDIAVNTTVYAVYTTTQNNEGGLYQGIDGGHGEELETIAGGDPSAFSLGLVWKF